jgi:hypothetical protein
MSSNKYEYLYLKYKTKYINLLNQTGNGKEKDALVTQLSSSGLDMKMLKKLDTDELKALKILLDNGDNKEEAYANVQKIDLDRFFDLVNNNCFPKLVCMELLNYKMYKNDVYRNKNEHFNLTSNNKFYKKVISAICASIRKQLDKKTLLKFNVNSLYESNAELPYDSKRGYTSIVSQIIYQLSLYYDIFYNSQTMLKDDKFTLEKKMDQLIEAIIVGIEGDLENNSLIKRNILYLIFTNHRKIFIRHDHESDSKKYFLLISNLIKVLYYNTDPTITYDTITQIYEKLRKCVLLFIKTFDFIGENYFNRDLSSLYETYKDTDLGGHDMILLSHILSVIANVKPPSSSISIVKFIWQLETFHAFWLEYCLTSDLILNNKPQEILPSLQSQKFKDYYSIIQNFLYYILDEKYDRFPESQKINDRILKILNLADSSPICEMIVSYIYYGYININIKSEFIKPINELSEMMHMHPYSIYPTFILYDISNPTKFMEGLKKATNRTTITDEDFDKYMETVGIGRRNYKLENFREEINLKHKAMEDAAAKDKEKDAEFAREKARADANFISAYRSESLTSYEPSLVDHAIRGAVVGNMLSKLI